MEDASGIDGITHLVAEPQQQQQQQQQASSGPLVIGQ